MILCAVSDLEPGMEVGGSVPHPRRPQTELLRPGVTLDSRMIRYLHRLGVNELWVHHEATDDLDPAVAANLSQARLAVYGQLKTDLGRLSRATISTSQVQVYRQAVTGLVFELISSGKYAHLSHALLADPTHVFTHSANVAYLSVLVGLELEAYVMKQRQRLAPEHARDVVPLGLGAMLHDIGKLGLKEAVRRHHEIRPEPNGQEVLEAYHDHTLRGYRKLRETRLPATARQVVLNHHQRFDGSGWPDQAASVGRDLSEPQRATGIHIFSRIVAAANVLDNLLYDASGRKRPTVEALSEFHGSRFEGWFDPMVRDLMIRRIPPFPIGSLVRLSNDEQAVVTAPSFHQPCQPTVRLIDGRCGDDPGEHPVIDLAQEEGLFITEGAGRRVERHLFELPDPPPRRQARDDESTPRKKTA